MILKYQTNNGWVFISDLYKVETRLMMKKDAKDLDLTKEFHCISENKGDDIWVKLHYLFTRDIGFNKLIVTDINQVYLLNDEGKTIERIN